jgi:hypothetical protein
MTTATQTSDNRAYAATDAIETQQLAYVTALETQADTMVKAMSDAGTSLAETFALLFEYHAWEVHDVTELEYWTDYRGISPTSLVLPFHARKALVKATPTATIGQHIMMTGGSKATLSRDRAEFGIASPAKSDSQKGKHGNSDKQAKSDKPDVSTPVHPSAAKTQVSFETSDDNGSDVDVAGALAGKYDDETATASVIAWLGKHDVNVIADMLNNTLTDGQRTKLAGLINPVHVSSVKPSRNTGRVRNLASVSN